jgi:hypothetical protein
MDPSILAILYHVASFSAGCVFTMAGIFAYGMYLERDWLPDATPDTPAD